MKKGFMLGLMFFGMLGICSQASAENIFAGKVAASNTSVISAPYGGRVDNIYVHVGDYVGEDSLIATLGTDEVYALERSAEYLPAKAMTRKVLPKGMGQFCL